MPPADAPPLHVLHLLTSFQAGGVSRYVLELTAGLHAVGHRATCAGDRGDWRSRFETGPAHTHLIPMNHGPFGPWRSARQLERALADEPIDLIHAHHRRASLLGRRLARQRGVPLLFALHMPDIPIGAPWLWFSDFGDHTLTFSEEARQWLVGKAQVGAARITVIPHGIDARRFPEADDTQRHAARQALGLPEHAPVAAFVGRLSEPKQPDWLLDVAAAASDALPALHVLVMGDGPDRRALATRIEREGLGERVHLLGTGEPLPVYQACDLLLLPSRIEAFALACAEAMSVGRAVLRTRTGGWRDQIIEHRTGRAVDIDRHGFVNAAIEMLSDRAALHRMGRAAAQHAREHLPFDRQLDQTIALYRRMIGSRAHQP